MIRVEIVMLKMGDQQLPGIVATVAKVDTMSEFSIYIVLMS